jgi:septal ring factor EnvC (AmiA/AmiB activator)
MGIFHPMDFVFHPNYAYSEEANDSGADGSFLNMEMIWGFVGALGVLIPIATGIAYGLKRSVNAATQEFIKQSREQMRDHQNTVSNQITTVNNNVNEKFLASKESIIEIKNTIDDIDEKLDESRTQNTENRMRINDAERRLSNLENNRSANSPMSKFGTG